jgi:hypothetical protein
MTYTAGKRELNKTRIWITEIVLYSYIVLPRKKYVDNGEKRILKLIKALFIQILYIYASKA